MGSLLDFATQEVAEDVLVGALTDYLANPVHMVICVLYL